MIKFEKLPSDIQSRIPAAIAVLQRDANVVFAYLFGGGASSRPNPLSDLDIAVSVRNTVKLDEYRLALFDRLTDALGTSELDLVILNTAPLSLAGRILQNRRVLADKEPFRRHAYESLTLREFFDFRVKEEAFFARRFSHG
jgi:predicted nucleotidyltransferase